MDLLSEAWCNVTSGCLCVTTGRSLVKLVQFGCRAFKGEPRSVGKLFNSWVFCLWRSHATNREQIQRLEAQADVLALIKVSSCQKVLFWCVLLCGYLCGPLEQRGPKALTWAVSAIMNRCDWSNVAAPIIGHSFPRWYSSLPRRPARGNPSPVITGSLPRTSPATCASFRCCLGNINVTERYISCWFIGIPRWFKWGEHNQQNDKKQSH